MLKNSRKQSIAGSKTSQLDKELASLFGRSILVHSKRMSLEDVANEAEMVAEATRQLRQQEGQPEQQRRIVQAMAADAAAALCRWIREPSAMAKVIARSMN